MWKPTWEPEVTKNKWPAFHKHILDFEAQKDEPNLTMLPPDNIMSNLEQQSFAGKVTDKTWNYRLVLLHALAWRLGLKWRGRMGRRGCSGGWGGGWALCTAVQQLDSCIFDVIGRKRKGLLTPGRSNITLQSISWH